MAKRLWLWLCLAGLVAGCAAPGGEANLAATAPAAGPTATATTAPAAGPSPEEATSTQSAAVAPATETPPASTQPEPSATSTPAATMTPTPSPTVTSSPSATSITTPTAPPSTVTATLAVAPASTEPPGDAAQLVAAGLEVYRAQYCGTCHRLGAAGSAGTFGPPLDGMGATAAARIEDPVYIGEATTAAEYLFESIVRPKAFLAPGDEITSQSMPAYDFLSEQEIMALVQLLLAQQ